MDSIRLVLFAYCAGMLLVPISGEQITLNATEGNNFVFPHKLMGSGTLRCGGITCLMVVNGANTGGPHSRVMWNNSTGEVTIKNLSKNDSGAFILNRINSSPIIYKLTVHATPTATPTENQPSWWIPVLIVGLVVLVVLVLVLVLVFGPGPRFGFCKKRRNRTSAADSTPTANGNVENLPIMPPGDGLQRPEV